MGYERYKDWYEEAMDDLGAARELMELGRYSKACFFCHQACEKALKALMIKRLGRYRPTHSVAELLAELGRVVEVPRELVRKGEKLDRYYVPTRYPNAWPAGPPHKHYDEEDAREALSCAREVMRFVERELRNGPREAGAHPAPELEGLVEELVEEYRPVAIILAGSLAQGRFVQGLSDVDILVVTEGSLPKGRRFALRAVRGADVEITAVTLDELVRAVEAGNQFYRDALLRGVEVYGRLPRRVYELARRARAGGGAAPSAAGR